MYKKTVYKYLRDCTTYYSREKVVNDFMKDIVNCRPVNVRENKKSFSVFFNDGKFQVRYTLPLEYKKYIVKGGM